MKPSTSTLLFAIVVAAMFSLAAGAELKHTAPPKVNLSGIWELNAELSDDPYKAVEKKQRDHAEGGRAGGGPIGGHGGTPRGGIVIDAGDILDGVFGGSTGGSARRSSGGGANDRPEDDPEPYSMRAPLDSFLATVEQFEIAQEPDSLRISTIEETNVCKPADPGEAPVPGGDLARRRCGWRGDVWVTETTARDGVTRSQRYELRKNGQQLVVISEIKGGKTELAGLRIKRVYDRVL